MNFFNNCNITLSIISLIKLILNYKSNTDDYSQVCTLAIKGLDKYKNFIFKLSSILDVSKIFVSFYQFFSEFEKTNEKLIPHNINEENALSMINLMIYEFIKIYGDKIWDIYQNSLSNEIKRLDIHFKRCIELILKNIKNANFLINNNLEIDNIFNQNNKNNSNGNKNIFLNSYNNNLMANNIENKNYKNDMSEQSDLMNLINKLKENGNMINETEKNNYYVKIISLLKENGQPITLLSNKLNNEHYSKIYELYHSYNQPMSSKSKNIFCNELNNIKSIIALNTSKNEFNNDNKPNIYTFNLTEQDKRIKEYKNKLYSITENNISNKNVLFLKNVNNNFNFTGNINNENERIDNNDYPGNNKDIFFDLEKRKRQLEELTKGSLNNKSIFNSHSDSIPKINQPFINNEKSNFSQSSRYEELVKNMKKNLENIRLRMIKNSNK